MKSEKNFYQKRNNMSDEKKVVVPCGTRGTDKTENTPVAQDSTEDRVAEALGRSNEGPSVNKTRDLSTWYHYVDWTTWPPRPTIPGARPMLPILDPYGDYPVTVSEPNPYVRDTPDTLALTRNETAIEYCERMYPLCTTEFKRLQDEMYVTFCKKQRNYGPANISVGTPLTTPEDIKLSLTGLFFRMNDKIQRIKQLVVMGQPDEVGEAIDDTYEDLSVYGIIARLVNTGKWGK